MARDLLQKHTGDTKSSQLPRRLSLVVFVVVFALSVLLPTQIVRAEEEKRKGLSASKVAVGAASLVLQPIYVAVKLVMASVGVVLSGATLVATAGDEEAAKKVLNVGLAGPWGFPELFEKKESDSSE